jgi:Trk K+ transport system NAD-binding subunit
MADRSRLLRYYLLAVVGSLAAFTVAYDAGMSAFEGRPRTLLHSFEVVLQTFTTTGYGQDAPWETPEMTLLVVSMQVASLVLIFSALPVVVVPLVEDALRSTPPTERSDLDGHVVVCGSSPRTSTLVREFESREVPYVVVEPDREAAQSLFDAGRSVVHGDPESAETLADLDVAEARAVVADADDRVDLSVIMAVRVVAPDVPVYSVVEDESLVTYHEHAGADRVFSPREILGRGLANKVRTAVDVAFDDPSVERAVELGELAVGHDEALAGRRLGETGIVDRSGVRFVGAWARGAFHSPPLSDLRLDEHTVLLVAGSPTALDALERVAGTPVRTHRRGDVVLAGFGVVGTTVDDALVADGIPRTIVDVDDDPAVDVVGDATDPGTLRRAGVPDAETVVIALDDDTTALLATFVVRELNPDAELLARADEAESVRKLYRAGANYVLSLASVTGRLLASAILGDVSDLAVEDRVVLARESAAPVAGQRLEELRIPERVGCTVVGIEHRDGRVDVDLGGWTTPSASDSLLVAGLSSDVERFRREILGESDESDASGGSTGQAGGAASSDGG